MCREPVHIESSGQVSDRQAIWQAIRLLGRDDEPFNSSDIRGLMKGHTGLPKISDYTTCLVAGGYLKKTAQPRGRPSEFTLIKDCGVDAPRLRKDGTEVTQGSIQEQMWRTMRIIGQFDYRELAVTASTEQHPVKENDASSYVGHLHKAGYLVLIARANNGGGLAHYLLLPSMNTGPKAPMVQRIKQVFDPNLNKVMWTPGGDQ